MPNTDIVVTEIMYDPPQSVHDNNHEWVEITNTGTGSIAMNGWTLDDSNTANSGVGSFADITLNPGDIAILYNDNITEAEFIALYNPAPGTILIPVAGWQPLNNSGGDSVQIFDENSNIVDTVAYPDDASPGQSLNYTPDGTYEGAGVPDPGVVCFTAGSLIDTAHGPRRIESLTPGDKIRTLDHGLQTLRWIGRRVVSTAEQIRHPALCPVEIEKSALGPQTPVRRTRVSPQHRLLLTHSTVSTLFNQPHMLCAAISLVGQPGICQRSPGKPVEYVHILFDRHEVVFVDGHASESFFPSQDGLSALTPLARAELFALFPEINSAALPLAYPVMSVAEAALLNQ
ncbi:MAG TPA: hypothetical protein EYG79_01790 [Rhodobacteraceae bacterium]|nr:hypothetical protein [Paracoccaceae bacterium]